MKVYEFNPQTGGVKVYVFPVIMAIAIGVLAGKGLICCVEAVSDKLDDWATNRLKKKGHQETA